MREETDQHAAPHALFLWLAALTMLLAVGLGAGYGRADPGNPRIVVISKTGHYLGSWEL